MSSRASELFDELMLASSPTQAIEEMVRRQQPETEYLEFKGGELSPKDAKRYWSKVLSGFANTEGGVLIWGVDARKTPSADDPSVEIEAARDTVYVPNPIEFAEMLRRVQLHVAVDPVAGVIIKPIPTDSGPGFVACFIPQGKHPPYRAALDDTQNYFQRVGDSFVVISHSFLRTLFHPRIYPELSVTVSFKPRVHDEWKVMRCWITVHNSGTGTARDLCALVTATHPWGLATAGNNIEERNVFRQGDTRSHLLHPKHDLHPDQQVDVCRIDFDTSHGWFRESDRPQICHFNVKEAQFPIRLFCVDSPEQVIPVRFEIDEINDRETKRLFPTVT